MIGRFQSYNRMKINVKENLINSWTHLKDGLSGSEDIRLKACSILWFFAKVSQSVAVFNTCYAQFHPGEGDLSPLNKKRSSLAYFQEPKPNFGQKKTNKRVPLCLCETLCLSVCETLCARLCVRDSVCVKRQSILVCGRLMAAKMFTRHFNTLRARCPSAGTFASWHSLAQPFSAPAVNPQCREGRRRTGCVWIKPIKQDRSPCDHQGPDAHTWIMA